MGRKTPFNDFQICHEGKYQKLDGVGRFIYAVYAYFIFHSGCLSVILQEIDVPQTLLCASNPSYVMLHCATVVCLRPFTRYCHLSQPFPAYLHLSLSEMAIQGFFWICQFISWDEPQMFKPNTHMFVVNLLSYKYIVLFIPALSSSALFKISS